MTLEIEHYCIIGAVLFLVLAYFVSAWWNSRERSSITLNRVAEFYLQQHGHLDSSRFYAVAVSLDAGDLMGHCDRTNPSPISEFRTLGEAIEGCKSISSRQTETLVCLYSGELKVIDGFEDGKSVSPPGEP